MSRIQCSSPGELYILHGLPGLTGRVKCVSLPFWIKDKEQGRFTYWDFATEIWMGEKDRNLAWKKKDNVKHFFFF